MNIELAYDFCEAVTAQEAKNFAYGIRLLRRPERRALSAVYALARRIDDIGDGHGSARARSWPDCRRSARSIDPIDPETNDPVLVAVADAAGVTGCRCRASARSSTAARWTSSAPPTRRSTISSATAAGWRARWAGSRSPCSARRDRERAVPLADALGVALQLTNILRDVVEDRSLGRVYLPSSDAESVGCAPEPHGPAGRVARLVALECGRAERVVRRGAAAPAAAGRPGPGLRRGHGRDLQAPARADQGEPIAVTRGRVSLPSLGEGLGRGAQPRRGAHREPASHRRRRGRPGGDGRGTCRRPTAGPRSCSFERRPVLGGLTSSIRRNGLCFDNGQHVFLRCCTAYRGFIDRIGATGQGLPAGPRSTCRCSRRTARAPRSGGRRLPAPLHLAGVARALPPPVAARAGRASARPRSRSAARPRRPALDDVYVRRLARRATARASGRSSASGT